MKTTGLEGAFELFNGDETPPSVLGALLPARVTLTVDEVFASLEHQFEEELTGIEVAEPTVPGAQWEMQIQVKLAAATSDESRAEERTFICWFGEVTTESLVAFEQRDLTPDEGEEAGEVSFVLGLAALFHDNPLSELRFFYRLLLIAAPASRLFCDFGARTLRGRRFVNDMAFTAVEPPPSLLYTVHAFADDDGKKTLQTLGLRRCFLPELTIGALGPDEVPLCRHLIERTALRFLELGLSPADEAFAIGDGIELVWLPSEEVEAYSAKDLDGAPELSTAVLFAPVGAATWRRLESPTIYAGSVDVWNDAFSTQHENQGRRLLAYERFGRFKALFDVYHRSKDWSFFVYAGLVDDGPLSQPDSYCWLRVEQTTERGFMAQLVGSPVRVTDSDGTKRHYELHFMIDWLIDTPYGYFVPSTVAVLEGCLEETSPGSTR